MGAVGGSERENTVFCVSGGFDVCVCVAGGLAVLQLNERFDFILNQLEKAHVFRGESPTWRPTADLPVFGTGTVLAERVFALDIAFQPAGTDAASGPVAENNRIRLKSVSSSVSEQPPHAGQ